MHYAVIMSYYEFKVQLYSKTPGNVQNDFLLCKLGESVSLFSIISCPTICALWGLQLSSTFNQYTTQTHTHSHSHSHTIIF